LPKKEIKSSYDSQMPHKAQVTKNGAVLLGDNVACDGFDGDRPLRVVTHAHADHLLGIRKSIKQCQKVLMTSATRDLTETINETLKLQDAPIQTVEYGKTICFGEEKITLQKADHILGAAQVLVEDAGGIKIAYSGDFKLDKSPPVNCDVLVVDSTYGKPSFRRSFDEDVRELLVSMVEKRLRGGTVYVFGFHGKLQEVMQLLTDADVEVPFVMPERVYNVSKVCQKHGMRVGCLTLSTDKEGHELLEQDLPCVAFYHVNSRQHVGLRSSRICVSGWEFRMPCRQIGQREHLVALSDHCDFDVIVEYVRQTRAKQVITDNYRGGHGAILAKELIKRLGISAVAMPKTTGQTTL
jgi:putative mRNA 3-end processing factor